ncbi:MAG: sulfite exporter TauE/SafE family protein [Candidatus Bathyarchaeia archaeon]
MWEWLLPLSGFLIGIAAALTGVGGGIFIVPLLTLLYGFPPWIAIGTSLAAIILTSIASTVNYTKQKRIYFKIGAILILATAPGGYVGSTLLGIPEVKPWIGLIFGIFLIMVAIQMIWKAQSAKNKKDNLSKDPLFEKTLFENKKKLLLGFGLSFFGGVVSGLLGVGGGTVLVPIMCYVLDFPIHFSIPTSMYIMIFTSITGVYGHLSQGNVNVETAVLLGVGSIFGAQVGAYSLKKFSSRSLSLVFAGMLIVASVNMILKSFKII